MIVNAITSFLGLLVEQVMRPVRTLLANTLLATPDITGQSDIKRLWAAMLSITGGFYVLFVTAGGLTVMGYETVQTRFTIKQIAPRLLLGLAAAAGSLTVMGKSIELSNAVAHAVMATDMSDAGKGMVEGVLPFALFGTSGLQLFLLLLAIVMVVLVLAVVIGFLMRVAVMALLAVAAPLMLACHAHPLTDPVARLWWRGLAGCLVIQVAQSTTFVLALKLLFAPGATILGLPKPDQLGTMLAGIALFWVLFKIPGWTLQSVLRGTLVHQPHAPAGVRALKHLAMYQLIGSQLPGTALLRPRSSGGRGGGGAGGPGLGKGGGGPRRGGPSGSGRTGGRPPSVGPGGGGKGRAHPAPGRPTGPGPRAQAGPPSRTPSPPPPRILARPTRRGGEPRTRMRTAPRPFPLRTDPALRAPAPRSATAGSAQHASTTPPARTERPSAPSTVDPVRPATTSRPRQLTLPFPVERVRSRPPRPLQLRLPLETPRR
ncbi:hypothetical protein POF50_030985 [Streptomyces sp. SL13]|uniref:TrbL/VirB6 plasmid conjugal transfer protein n=1 Tax=Streptantibioticus silvisoli TaxID=2705255 RepID=A0AA90HBE4_9ACTN|nr:hypothetical protein [Streptantibioticus silvisoli]MDI5973714.1 hypothetical protein [Streptantibioticus silvisoli]